METVQDLRRLPELHAETIHIWGIHIPAIKGRMDALGRVLSRGEAEKASRFRRAGDRDASIAARGALRILLSGYTGLPADNIEFTYSENGKPHLAGSRVAFNVSHSGEWIVIACGRDRVIGVDIEQIRPEMDVRSIAARCYATDELAVLDQAEDPHGMFFHLWARREAYIKARGSTLFSELKRSPVPAGNGAEKQGWYFHDLEAGSKYAAAVVTDKPVTGIPCYDFGGLQWRS
jgi:4'-phosphopantetheinyl transferase